MDAINGITLERYAQLGAEVEGITDPAQQGSIVEQHGVSAADWAAAVQGWTARMQDPGNMGQVATAYMPMYQAALNAKRGSVSISFDDWVAMEAAIQVMGFEGMLANYGIDQGTWSQISGAKQQELMADPMGLGQRRMMMQQQEVARLQGGGAPRPVSIQGGQPAAAAPAAAAPAPAAYPAAAPAGPGYAAGARVMVQWNDGNKYPGEVTQASQGQSEVRFPDGQAVWVEDQWLSPG